MFDSKTDRLIWAYVSHSSRIVRRFFNKSDYSLDEWMYSSVFCLSVILSYSRLID